MLQAIWKYLKLLITSMKYLTLMKFEGTPIENNNFKHFTTKFHELRDDW